MKPLPKKEKSHRAVMTLPDNMYQAIKTHAKRSNAPISAVLRHAVEQWLLAQGDEVENNVTWGGYRRHDDDEDDRAVGGVPEGHRDGGRTHQDQDDRAGELGQKQAGAPRAARVGHAVGAVAAQALGGLSAGQSGGCGGERALP